MIRPISLFLALSLLPGAAQANGISGADALLQSVQPSATTGTEAEDAASASAASSPMISGIKLDDPFTMQLFSEWQQAGISNYELNAWVLRVLKGEHEAAAHQWSAIQKLIPDSFREQARAAWLYVLWKLKLPQSFFEEWASLAQSSKGFFDSRLAIALDQVLHAGFDQWLIDEAIQVMPEHEAFLSRFTGRQGLLAQTIQAWAMQRKGEQGSSLLHSLPHSHLMKIPLAQTVALAQARKRDLASAGRTLKAELEPAIEASGTALDLSFYFLQIARLLYQAGALDAAASYYERIPAKAPEFFKAQEELTWVWLRQGENSKLRGHLTTLGSRLYEDKFAPEVFLVRAISNLKHCYYDEVEKDFRNFIARNGEWAKRIDAALASQSPPAPPRPDRFSLLSARMIEQRAKEAKRLDELATTSIQAVLPAVGPQSHWVRLRDRMASLTESARKIQAAEHRRQWSNYRAELSEAIRKMQFVKVEAMSQVRALSRAPDTTEDSIRISHAAPQRTTPKAIAAEGKIVFPFDGVLWPDEMFRLNSVARDRCLQGGSR